jgi:cardiolipin synthase A/B
MHRKHVVASTIFLSSLIYLIFSGSIQIRTGTEEKIISTTNSSYVSWTIYEQLTGKLYISPFWSHDAIIATLDQAKYTIAIRWYQITDKELIRLLLNKAKSGIEVRIILENSMYGNAWEDYISFAEQIQWSSIKLISDEHLGTVFMHAKTMIVDTEKFIVSTANSTYPWFSANREYWFVSRQPTYAKLLQEVFERDRNTTEKTITIPDNLRICPFNCRTQLNTLINEATTSIDIQAQYLEDPELIKQLQEKIRQGINVRLIFGKYQEDILPSELQSHTRIQSYPNVHAKNILIDNKKMYIWSMNLSTNAIENNREIGIVTEDRFVLETFRKQFVEDWETKALPYK